MVILGVAFDLRHPADLGADRGEIYRAALDMASWAEDNGFDMFGLGEHHQSPDGYIPQPCFRVRHRGSHHAHQGAAVDPPCAALQPGGPRRGRSPSPTSASRGG